MFLDTLEKLRTLWKVSGISGKFPEFLESLRTLWKVSGQYAMFLDHLESVQTLSFKKSEKFPHTVENFLDTLKSFWKLWNVSETS